MVKVKMSLFSFDSFFKNQFDTDFDTDSAIEYKKYMNKSKFGNRRNMCPTKHKLTY